MSLKLINIGELVTYNSEKKSMVILKDIEIAIENGKISDIGTLVGDCDEILDCKKKLITPGYIDSHTHPVFVKSRYNDFFDRLSGLTYKNIQEKGGGIISSVKDVRKASYKKLIRCVKNRMDRFINMGTTTVECKTGYGLSLESELKSLDVLDKVNSIHEIDIIATFMGAHAIPPEYTNNRSDYVKIICDDMIPSVKKQGIAIFNDVFCEEGYFSIDESRKIMLTAKLHGLFNRIHADEFNDFGGGELAAETHAISADHLMNISEKNIGKMVDNGVIGTLLPGTTFSLGINNYAPYKKMKEMGLEIALATDYNPGSCNIKSMSFIISLACIFLGMNPLDAIKAATYTSAKSLLIDKMTGSIEVGKNSDIVVWDFDSHIKIPFMVTNHPIKHIIKSGKLLN